MGEGNLKVYVYIVLAFYRIFSSDKTEGCEPKVRHRQFQPFDINGV